MKPKYSHRGIDPRVRDHLNTAHELKEELIQRGRELFELTQAINSIIVQVAVELITTSMILEKKGEKP